MDIFRVKWHSMVDMVLISQQISKPITSSVESGNSEFIPMDLMPNAVAHMVAAVTLFILDHAVNALAGFQS